MLNELSPRPGARTRRKRVGRGPGSGKGKTCGTGVKGQGTRSGKKIKPWFEGGQMPLYQRVPKKGFTNRFRVVNEIVNLGELAVFGDNATVDATVLAAKGLIRGAGTPVKVLAEGDAPKGLKLTANKISAAAHAKIEAAGGSVEIVALSTSRKAEGKA
jgi:large subunit ribosomal protein L15